MTLFEHHQRQQLQKVAPLATRMRPRVFADLVGQDGIVGPGKALRLSIEADRVPSMIIWGPPGSGKTTLALIVANTTHAHFEQLSAVTSGVADLRRIANEARDRLGLYNQRTVLFVDEIHRFNKGQQDVVLPHVEDGTVTLIGATTENPSFEVITPLISRSRVVTLSSLTEKHIAMIIDRALTDVDMGLGDMNVTLDKNAKTLLLNIANGDARVALNGLELASFATPPDDRGVRLVTLEAIEDAFQQRLLAYDKNGSQHYDTISAYIKSVRASDPDAAIYWLARMVAAGEDPLFIARRIVILAAEDIGMADPQALPVAIAAQQAIHFIGMPEAAIPMAQATIYLSTAPKSNSAYSALNEAMQDVQLTRNDPIPLHLRNPATSLLKNIGYGHGYRYPHNYTDNFSGQANLPNNLKGKTYYNPSGQGYEKEVASRLRQLWNAHNGQLSDDNQAHN